MSTPVRPLRLAYLVSEYPTTTHTFVLREVNTLRRLGIDVHVISLHSPNVRKEALGDEEYREIASSDYIDKASIARLIVAHFEVIHRSPLAYLRTLQLALCLAGFDYGMLRSYLLAFAATPLVASIIRSRRLDHVHVHFATNIVPLLSELSGIPVSITLHGPAEFEGPNRLRLPEKVHRSAFVRTISWFGRSQVLLNSSSSDWSKVEVIYLGVNAVPKLTRATQSGTPTRLISVGRLDRVKGHELLLHAIAPLIHEGRKIELCIVGDGPDREHLQGVSRKLNISNSVTLAGPADQHRVRKLLARSDVFVLASLAEGLPVALMEAMAHSLPCVAIRIAGIPELIRDRVDGLLVAPANRDALSAAVAQLVDNEDLRRSIGENARRRIADAFDLNTNSAALANLFNRTCLGADANLANKVPPLLQKSGVRTRRVLLPSNRL
jgi:glycosyltransferase involved in cell wall biosynthesis